MGVGKGMVEHLLARDGRGSVDGGWGSWRKWIRKLAQFANVYKTVSVAWSLYGFRVLYLVLLSTSALGDHCGALDMRSGFFFG